MKKLLAKLSALVLAAVMVCGIVPLASAETRTPTSVPGWEGWAAELYQFLPADAPSLFLTCPKASATDEEIYYYVGKLISENLGGETTMWLFFPQPGWSQAEGDAWAQANGGLLRRKWQYGSSYLDVGMNFQNGNVQICVQRVEPDRELTAKVAEIGEAARAASDTVRGQLDYINRYLCDTVEYAGDGEPAAHNSARSALIEGYAYCGGFASATSMLCNYLGIPNISVHNAGMTTRSDTHVWNYVYVDGEWKHLDVTWNSGNVTGTISDEELAQLTEWKRTFFFLRDELDGTDGVHVYNTDVLTAQQTTALKGWDGVMEPKRMLAATNHLTGLDILRGDENGNLNLNAGLTRAELATILTRISGAEDEVLAEKARYAALCTFADVPDWAAPYVGYCVEQGLVTGYNTTTYGAADPVTPAALCTVILRHMGHPETDWNYTTAITKAASVGLVSPYWPTGSVALRADIALLAYAAMD